MIKSSNLFVAEQKLLASLAKPRKSHATHSHKLHSLEISSHDLSLYRQKKSNSNNSDDSSSPSKELIASVRALHHQHRASCIKTPASNYSKIKANAITKRDRHDESQKRYSEAVKILSDDLEAKILKLSDDLKSKLEEKDEEIKSVFKTLDDDDVMVTKDHSYVRLQWEETLSGICHSRTEEIELYATRLDDIEVERTALVGNELSTLTDSLVAIGHVLPQESERIVEREAYELNLVLIANRRSHADLLLRIHEQDVTAYVSSRVKWEECERHWRKLRHDDAIANFHKILNATEFTSPSDRQAICDELTAEYVKCHEDSRLRLLSDLSNLCRHNDDDVVFDAAATNNVLASLEELYKTENERNEMYFAKLTECHEAKVKEAATRREELRSSLHVFGALAAEGSVADSHDVLSKFIADEEQADFFRVAGALKPELRHIVDSLAGSLIYTPVIDELLPRVALIVASCNLSEILEEIGKSEDRVALQATLEKLRKAPKSDIISILPTLESLVAGMMLISGLNPLFATELESIHDALCEIIEVADGANNSTSIGGATPTEVNSTCTSRVPGTTTATTTITASSSSLKSKVSSSYTSSTLGIPGLDLQTIRRVQRRLGAILYATDLPPEIKATVATVMQELSTQRVANDTIDNVVAQECTDLIATRERESSLLLNNIGLTLESQSNRLHEECTKITKFYRDVATSLTCHSKDAAAISLNAKILLADLEDDYDAANDALEDSFKVSQSSVRHAPDAETLEKDFNKCLDTLSSIEDGYRLYYQRGRTASRNHPIVVEDDESRYIATLCAKYGLEPLFNFEQDATVMAKLLDKEEVEKQVAKVGENEGDSAAVALKEDEVLDATNTTSVADNDASVADNDDDAAAVTTEEDHGQYTAPDGTVYNIIKPLEDVVADIVAPTIDDDEEEQQQSPPPPQDQQDVEETIPDQDKTLSATEQVEDDETSTVPAITTTTTEDKEKTAATILTQELIPTITLSIPSLFLPMVTTLVNETLGIQGAARERAICDANATRDERLEDFTLELEERLRQHWPRKGRLDVLMYQPRAGELVSHRKRHDRMLRSIKSKLVSQASEFDAALVSIQGLIDDYKQDQLNFVVQLPMQSSIAALQGLEHRVKTSVGNFNTVAHNALSQVSRKFLTDLPTHLSNLCNDIVNTASHQLFPDLESVDNVISGCDYHPTEVSHLRSLVSATQLNIDAETSARSERLELLKTAVADTLQTNDDDDDVFKARYQECLTTLSMSEGLGQKYGTPRRVAQEAIRSEIARSNEASQEIQECLDNLAILATGSVALTGRKAPTTVRSQIRHLLLRLRVALHDRVSYLGCWKDGDKKIVNATRTIPSDFNSSQVENSSKFYKVATSRVNADPSVEATTEVSKFLSVIDTIKANCISDTIALFKEEGKSDELPTTENSKYGVPQSLETYLDEQVLKCRELCDAQTTTMRQQISTCATLLASLPHAAMTDLKNCISKYEEGEISRATLKCGATLKDLKEQKVRHQSQLRPDLCSPNAAARLETLCQDEKSRSEAAQEELRLIKTSLLEIKKKYGGIFERNFTAVALSMMALLDSFVLPVDLEGGGNEEDGERKSLKRLRKARRRKETGDPREVTDDSDKRSLPKRQWPSIPEYGEVLQNEESVENDGSCVAFLTSAHRSAIRARDAIHADFVVAHKESVENISQKYTSMLQDEAQWWENWQREIDVMRREVD